MGEDVVDRALEQTSDLERERERGIVLADLERVDRLAADAEPFRELRLRPLALGAQDTQRVLHA